MDPGVAAGRALWVRARAAHPQDFPYLATASWPWAPAPGPRRRRRAPGGFSLSGNPKIGPRWPKAVENRAYLATVRYFGRPKAARRPWKRGYLAIGA